MNKNTTADGSEEEAWQDSDGGNEVEPTSTARTPLFVAYNSARYHRQDLIRNIQNQSQSHLICYVSGAQCMIAQDDVIQFGDLLHNIPDGENH